VDLAHGVEVEVGRLPHGVQQPGDLPPLAGEGAGQEALPDGGPPCPPAGQIARGASNAPGTRSAGLVVRARILVTSTADAVSPK
jgi:hypothetical protein